ncbi:MAG: AraC family transcriptional regulator, partial [Cyanobacteria bacterium J06576_12]
MAIELTHDQFREQFQAADAEQLQWDADDAQDVTYQFDSQISNGWLRKICLRAGLWLYIDRHQQADRVTIKYPDKEVQNIHCTFTLSGKGEISFPFISANATIADTAGNYSLGSNGYTPPSMNAYVETEPCSFLELEMQPEILRSFAGDSEERLPNNLQHIIKTTGEARYFRHSTTQPMMAAVLQQIAHCPYQGTVKRMYLEGKVIELMALVLDHEILIQQGELKKESLKPEQLQRVHYAKEILLRNMNNPPSLAALARQVGLNDRLLKSGFRQ